MYTVYRHTCPNGKVYIGITSQKPEHRWKNGKGYIENEHFYRAIEKYGWDNIKHEILLENLTEEDACQYEIELIATYSSNNPEYGYNNAAGGHLNLMPNIDFSKRLENITYERVKQDKFLNSIFEAIKKSAFGFTYTETITKEIYGDGVLVSTQTQEVEREEEPSINALTMLIVNFEDEPELKDLIIKAKLLKDKILRGIYEI